MSSHRQKERKETIVSSVWTCLEFGACEEAPRQQFACLNGDRCQLQLALQNVPNGVDMRNIRLLLVVNRNFSIPVKQTETNKKINTLQTQDTFDESNYIFAAVFISFFPNWQNWSFINRKDAQHKAEVKENSSKVKLNRTHSQQSPAWKPAVTQQSEQFVGSIWNLLRS